MRWVGWLAGIAAASTGLACSEPNPCQRRTGSTDDAAVEVVQLAAGSTHTCALLSNGAVRCWGSGTFGRLGRGDTCRVGDDESPAAAGDAVLGGRAVSIGVGGSHTCAVLESGAVRCWGGGSLGQLGYGNCTADQSTVDPGCDVGDDEAPADVGPVPIGGPSIGIAAGQNSTCVVMESGSVRCWGEGLLGSLGYGNCVAGPLDGLQCSIGDDETPAQVGDVPLGATARHVALGAYHGCALLDTGAVRCWGPFFYGQLGYGDANTIGDDDTPEQAGDVDVGDAATAIAAGGNHTCAILAGGRLRCWGSNRYGQLGYGHRDDIGDSMDSLPSMAGDVDVGGVVVQVAAGEEHTCALLESGAVRCWGYNSRGRLGYGTRDPITIGQEEVPADVAEVPLGGPAVQITAGFAHTCALLESGAVRCWGEGVFGQLGYGNCIPDDPEYMRSCDIGDDETPAEAGDVPVLTR